jgi:hypothetical protein
MPQLAGTAPNTPGDMRMLLVLGFGGGVFTGSGFGGEVRIEGQVNEWATLGGGLGGGYNRDGTSETRSKRNLPDWIYGVRGWGRVNPGSVDWLAITAGAGISGTNRGTVALTFDASTLFGHAFELGDAPSGEAFRLAPYGGPAAALSIPLRQGAQIHKRRIWLGFGPDVPTSSTPELVEFTTTFYVGAQAGLAADSGRTPAWTGALELTMLSAFGGSEGALVVAFATGQGARIKGANHF